MANGGRGGRSQRMPKHWHPIAGGSQGFTVNATALIGTLGTFATPFTVIRMLGEYIIGPDAAPAAADSCRVGVGIGVVSTDAATLGATAMPDPSGEPDFPWLYWAEHAFFFVGTSLEDQAVAQLRHSFDVRSMRKVKPRESLVMVVEYVDVNGAPPMQVETAATRVLVAE